MFMITGVEARRRHDGGPDAFPGVSYIYIDLYIFYILT